MSSILEVAPEVGAALEAGRAVVCLETSISVQGLPPPYDIEVAEKCLAAVREAGAVPAVVAVVDGRVRIGASLEDIKRLAALRAPKVSARGLGFLAAAGGSGATTVAATVRAAHLAGIRFAATGGIGGVHRGAPFDVSADLDELARSQVAIFCAGAKLVLDIPLTLERLESLSVPVLGYRTAVFPGFYVRDSGHPVDGTAGDPGEVARAVDAAWATGSRGVVVAVPPPAELEGAREIVERAVAELGDLHGPEATPRLLARVAELSGGRSVPPNVELAVNNARVAAESAVAWAAIAR